MGRGRSDSSCVQPMGRVSAGEVILAENLAHKVNMGVGRRSAQGHWVDQSRKGQGDWWESGWASRLGAGGWESALTSDWKILFSLSPNHLRSKVAITEAEEKSSMEKKMDEAPPQHVTTAAVGTAEKQDCWRIMIVLIVWHFIPIQKKGNAKECSNYLVLRFMGSQRVRHD